MNRKKIQKRRIGIALIRALPLLFMLLMFFLFLRYRNLIHVESILRLAPDSLWATAIMLLLFYVVKSLTFVFPVVILQLSAGLLFPLPIALLLNLLGTAIGVSIPFWIGRFSGGNMVQRQMDKHPKLRRLTELYRGRELFFSYLVRVASGLAMDVASLLLGAMRLPYGRYMAGTMLGMLPGLLAVTFLGENIMQPGSPAFIGSALMLVSIGVISALVYVRQVKRA